jgi:hypothetical protein
MKKLFIEISIFIIISFIYFINSNSGGGEESTTSATETFNPTGICESVPHPHESHDCFSQTNGTYSCCYATIIDSQYNLNESTCLPIIYRYKFAAPFIKNINYESHKNVSATVTCNLAPNKTCGTDHPSNSYECRSHGTVKTSCCMLETFTNTNCILKNIDYVLEKQESLYFEAWGNKVQCSGIMVQINIFVISLILIVFLLQ